MVKVTPSKEGGFRVEIRIRLPDGSRHRERVRSPVTSKSGSKAWGEARERHLLVHGPPRKKAPPAASPAPAVQTFGELWPSFLANAQANRQKASTLAAKEMIGRKYLLPVFAARRLDAMANSDGASLRATV
jgi:hypothetical protein